MDSKRLAFFLPNTFTALNIACGFAAMGLAIKGEAFNAALVLILGAIFDSVDGRVARMTGTQSSFGEQFDSMSDVVSFGVAPAVIMYSEYLSSLGRIGAVVSFIYLLCGALRLARFNANIDKVSSNYFQGMPIPGAAMALVGYVFLSDIFPTLKNYPWVALGYTLIYGVLMITNIPFPSFKDSIWVKEHKRAALFIFFIACAFTFSYYRYAFAINMLIYVVGSILYFLTHKRNFGDVFDWKNEND